MVTKRSIEMVGTKGTLAELEEADVLFYASLTPSKSLEIVENMRKMIWYKEYDLPMEMVTRFRNLKEEFDEFE